MSKKIIQRFLNSPSYLDNGSGFLAKRWGVPKHVIVECRRKARLLLQERKEIERPFKRLFYDIETTEYITRSWRIGYNINLSYDSVLKEPAIICVSYKWEGEDQVHHLRWKNDSMLEWDDSELVKEFAKVVAEADEMVAHNGDNFDIKWLRTRFITHGVPFPSYVRTYDTKSKAAKYFNFPNNKLTTIARKFGLGDKLDTDYALWTEVAFENNKEREDYMVEYCDRDVVVLEDVFHKLQSYVATNTHVGVHNGKAKWTCPVDGSENVTYLKPSVSRTGGIRRIFKCNDCGHTYSVTNLSYLDYAISQGNI